MRVKKTLKISAVVLAALVVAVVAIVMSIDFNAHRDTVAAQIEAATGRQMRIAGDLDLTLGFRPCLAAEGVTFANARWGSRPEMVRVGRLEAEVLLWPLLFGEVQVNRLILRDADILLETNAEGAGNWVFAGAEERAEASDETPVVPDLHEFSIRDSVLVHRAGQVTHRLEIKRLTGLPDLARGRLDASFIGTFDDVAFNLTGETGLLRRLAARDEPFPIDVKVAVADLEVALAGTIAEPLVGKGLDLAVKATAPGSAGLSTLVGEALPETGPISISLKLGDADGRYRLEQIALAFGESDVAGALTLTPEGPRPRVAGRLTSDRIDLRKLVPAGGPGPESRPDDGRLFSDARLDLAPLGLVDLDLAIAIGNLETGTLSLAEVQASLKLEAGTLTLKPASARLAGGDLTFTTTLDSAAKPARLALESRLQGGDLGDLVRTLADSDLITGKLDLNVAASGRGGSVRTLMAGLDGQASLVVTEGVIANKYADFLAADLLRAVAAGAQDRAETKVNCAVADFPIERGLATAKVLLIDTERITVTGEGTVNLATETLDLKLKPKPKDASLLSLATPVNVSGTLASPIATPDPTTLGTGVAAAVVGNILLPGIGLLAPLLSAGADEKHPCLKVAAGAGSKEKPGDRPASGAAAAKKKKEGGVGGFLKGIGRKIEETLGGGKQ